GQIGKRVLNVGGSASSLMSLLSDQRQFLQDAPPGLAGILGESGARQVGTYESAGARQVVEPRRPAPVTGVYQEPPRRRSAWLWALPVLALIPLLMFLFSSRSEPPRQAVVDTKPPAAPPRPEVTQPAPDVPRVIPPGGAAGLGAFVEQRLPNDV